MYGGGVIKEDMMCAQRGRKDSCQGDSGGPLYDKDNTALVGIISWGKKCGKPKYPGVYAQVGYQWYWIAFNICERHSEPKPLFCEGFTPLPTASPTTFPTANPSTSLVPTTNPTTFDCDGFDNNLFKLEIKFDSSPEEIKWNIKDKCNGNIVTASGGPYLDLPAHSHITDQKCLTQSFYKFTIIDKWGDGIYSPGQYEISYNGKLVGTGSEFGKSESWKFGSNHCLCKDRLDDDNTCKWAAKNPERRCPTWSKKTNSLVFQFCPKSCSMCEGMCQNKSGDCKDSKKSKCNQPAFAWKCPVKCNKCTQAQVV